MTFEVWQQNEIDNGSLIVATVIRTKSGYLPYKTCKWATRWNNIGSGVVDNEITFMEFLHKAYEAGITYSDVGFTMDKYQLSRYSDDGAYTVSSCRYALVSVNMNEKCDNGGTSSIRTLLKSKTGESNYMFKGYWVTPFGSFDTMVNASKSSGCSPSCVRSRCVSHAFPEWSFTPK